MTNLNKAIVSTPTEREILIERVFNAPAQLVYEAWTKPEHLRRWWWGNNAEMLVCEVDLRVGGTWRFVGVDPEAGEIGFTGVFQEINAPTRLVNTEIFEPMPDHSSLVTVTFTEQGGKTNVSSRTIYESQEVRDMVVQSGMEGGVHASYAALDGVLADLQSGSAS